MISLPIALPLQAASRNHADSAEGKMNYRDFVWFILSEEDKSNDVSLEYWFRCIDLDDDGDLKPNEMLVGLFSLGPLPQLYLMTFLCLPFSSILAHLICWIILHFAKVCMVQIPATMKLYAWLSILLLAAIFS